MKKLVLITIILIISSIATAQWIAQSPYPTSYTLREVFFINEYTGWSCGENGIVIFTNDSGETWVLQESGTLNELNSSFFVNANHGWIVGSDGTLLHTVDGGENWSDQSISDTINWYDIEFKDQNNGWIIGHTFEGSGIIMNTSDAGNNWELQLLESGQSFKDLCFTSLTSGWVIGNQGILHTNNGGETWNEQYNFVWTSSPTISFIDSLNGWANGGGPSKILKTADGGEIWVPDTVAVAIPFNSIFDINYLDTLNAWILCEAGEAGTEFTYTLNTSDGGISWNSTYFSLVDQIFSICFVNPVTGWLIGNYGNIEHTNNGVDWNLQSMMTNDKMITDVCFIDDQIGWALGNISYQFMQSKLLKTYNGGEDWEIIYNFWDWTNSLFVIDENNFWVIGEGFLHQTKDGGETWEFADPFEGNVTTDIFFTDVQHGWVSDWDIFSNWCKIFFTSNEGESWEEQYTGEGEYIASIYFADQNNGWIAGKSGDSGIIVNTFDGGDTWLHQLYANDQLFIKIHFFDMNNGFAIGYHGSVFQTNNGGEAWIQVNGGFDIDFYDVFLVDVNNIWAIGNMGQYPQQVFEGLIYYSSDGGQSWIEQEGGTSRELHGIWFNDADKGWVVGEYGTILHTENGGINDVPKTKVPKSDLQLKNYPNPFNSSTRIEFCLPEKGEIILLVYDMSGKIHERINLGKRLPGKHQFELNIEGLTNGIYFLRLEANGVSETIKVAIL